MSIQHYDDNTLIRWALTYAMTEKACVSVDWECVTLIANGNHVAFSELRDCCQQDKAATIMKKTADIWRELHAHTVD